VPTNAQVVIQFNEPVDTLTLKQVKVSSGGGTVNTRVARVRSQRHQRNQCQSLVRVGQLLKVILRLPLCKIHYAPEVDDGFMTPSESDLPIELGAWTGTNLRNTALQNVGLGSDADLPVALRFKAGVAKLLKRRIAVAAETQRLAVFLLQPIARSHKSELAPKTVPMLDNGRTSVAGRLWFVNEAVVSGKYIELEDMEDDVLFDTIINTLHLGTVPAIIFDPRTRVPSVRYYERGLVAMNDVEILQVSVSEITLSRILDVVQKIHNTCLITPEAQGVTKIWKNATKWWPESDAELRIQGQLRPGLVGAFPTCTVRQEQTSIPGRLDLEIEEKDVEDPSKCTRWAVLELKVLRSYGSTGDSVSAKETQEWIEKGVRQAASYRAEREARASALCCFDMRKAHAECFGHVQDLAANLKVELRVYLLFNTSEQYRIYITSEPQMSIRNVAGPQGPESADDA
jgi:hypothetical protein